MADLTCFQLHGRATVSHWAMASMDWLWLGANININVVPSCIILMNKCLFYSTEPLSCIISYCCCIVQKEPAGKHFIGRVHHVYPYILKTWNMAIHWCGVSLRWKFGISNNVYGNAVEECLRRVEMAPQRLTTRNARWHGRELQLSRRSSWPYGTPQSIA